MKLLLITVLMLVTITSCEVLEQCQNASQELESLHEVLKTSNTQLSKLIGQNQTVKNLNGTNGEFVIFSNTTNFCANYSTLIKETKHYINKIGNDLQITKEVVLDKFVNKQSKWSIGEIKENIETSIRKITEFKTNFELVKEDRQTQLQINTVAYNTIVFLGTCLRHVESSAFITHLGNFAISQESEQFTIRQYVATVYSNNTRNLKELLDFSEKVKTNSAKAVEIYEFLFQEMDLNNQTKSHEALTFVNHLERFLNKHGRNYSHKTRIDALLKNLTLYEEEILLHLKTEILTGQYEDVYNFARDNNEDLHFYENHLSNLISSVYANSITNFATIYGLVVGFTNPLDVVYGFSFLLNELMTQNEMNTPQLIVLAYGIQEASEKFGELDYHFENLKASLLPSVRQLIKRSKNCTVMNTHWKEYLYTTTSHLSWKSNRRVLTWIPGGPVEEGEWEFIYLGYCYFYIRNTLWDTYLSVMYPPHFYDVNKRVVVSVPANHTAASPRPLQDIANLLDQSKYVFNFQYIWKLEPRNGDIAIKHAMYGDSLFADEKQFDSERRYVFAWAKEQERTDGYWQIKCN